MRESSYDGKYQRDELKIQKMKNIANKTIVTNLVDVSHLRRYISLRRLIE